MPTFTCFVFRKVEKPRRHPHRSIFSLGLQKAINLLLLLLLSLNIVKLHFCFHYFYITNVFLILL